ncbi:hypothetical protein CR513_62452, partial [Mucuna pruriens]
MDVKFRGIYTECLTDILSWTNRSTKLFLLFDPCDSQLSYDDGGGEEGSGKLRLEAATLGGSGDTSEPTRCGKLSLAFRPRILKAALSYAKAASSSVT